jgi:hypothetical protein
MLCNNIDTALDLFGLGLIFACVAYRTPTPCLAIRRIVPSDIAFLDISKYEPAIRVQFLKSYLEQFETADSAGDRKDHGVGMLDVVAMRCGKVDGGVARCGEVDVGGGEVWCGRRGAGWWMLGW